MINYLFIALVIAAFVTTLRAAYSPNTMPLWMPVLLLTIIEALRVIVGAA